jgi:hypothetical protein
MTGEQFDLADFHCGRGKNVLVCYKGPFDKETLGILGTDIRKVISKNAMSGTKLFKVFIEMAHNISHYSAEKLSTGKRKEPGIGSLVLIDCKDHYRFITGNLIKNENIRPVIERCREINSLDRDRLRKLKREHLANGHADREGADIGLIQLALTSGNPLDIKTVAVDNSNSFLTITVKLNK